MGVDRVLAILCLCCATLPAADPPRPRAWEIIARDEALLGKLASMTLFARSRANHTEAAAFVVWREGTLSLVPWPDQFERHRQTWQGRIPDGAIAVVHTHPDRRPTLSLGDRDLARSTGLAVVALSRWAIWIADPDRSDPVPLVERRNWAAGAARTGRL